MNTSTTHLEEPETPSLPDVRFVGIPGIFVHHYREEIADWLKNFQLRGPRLSLWLRRDPTGIPLIMGDGSDKQPMVPIIKSIVTITAFRLAAYRHQGLVVKPMDEVHAKKIQKHSDELHEIYDVGEPGKWDIPLL